MKIDSKVKGGLAWTGLFVILAVPAANLVFGEGDAPKANVALAADVKPAVPALKAPADTAAVVPAAEVKTDPIKTASADVPAANGNDPVNTYLAKGKKLPSYISDADSAPAAKPAVPVTVAKPAAPLEVASINPVVETPPVPLPRTARPKTPVPVVASVPKAPAGEQPLIVDENELAQREATLGQPRKVEPFPLSDGASSAPDDQIVTGDQLEEWDSGSLADYLKRKGLLSEQRAQQQEADDSQVVFNERPNRPERRPLDSFFLF